ncbi:23S rRNA pseudouridine(955/2504/2580) synthase protein [Dioscorea alata]|uniref:23S rRNA pseudouridine(955/2504/2580) synthase protein n=1 Tax=Dioscorea alata TaxID=55571 RepID=A0ACB7UHZ0_DIOAL|nr:23S rRNA pseudouridine(955/2504/2580) synthase protein [Dioscorea alata]
MAELLHLLPCRHLSAKPWNFTALFSILLRSSYCSVPAQNKREDPQGERAGKWLSLPPFSPSIDSSLISKEIAGQASLEKREPITALKWVRRCCPELPMSLIQKLFRLRQVRKQSTIPKGTIIENNAGEKQIRRVSAKSAISLGDVILLPVSSEKSTNQMGGCSCSDDEINFIRRLELYKDSAMIVINKPPGMSVQGGVGIKYSLDKLATTCLKYNNPEPPRLVHRLDRDSSGVLVLGRTRISTSILHSIFRERTSGAVSHNLKIRSRPLQRKYWALVIGTPRDPNGLISAPLAKVVLDDGKSERITIVNDANIEKFTSSNHALTEYRVIRTSIQGYTWLELLPLTGRKHQLRVHCAEVLGTPIIGDYKYGWQSHKKWQPIACSTLSTKYENIPIKKLPFGLELEGGSIDEKQPRLHLHCRQMVLPDISVALKHLQSESSNYNLSKCEKINLVAPLPLHMQISWDILGYDS